MITGVHHIAIAVPDLEAALPLYKELFGFTLHAVEHESVVGDAVPGTDVVS